MPAKDALARGARSATYGVSGHAGDEIILKNVAPEEEPTECLAGPEPVKAATPRKTYRPLGNCVLVRRSEATTEAFSDIHSGLAASKPGLVLIQDEVNKEYPAEGVVLRVGADVDTVSQGEYVSFGKYSGAQLSPELTKSLGGGTLLLMSVDEILGIIEDETEETFEVAPSSVVATA